MKMIRIPLCLLTILFFTSCSNSPVDTNLKLSDYFNNRDSSEVRTGGIKMVPITTPKGNYNIWTKRIGNNATTKVLLINGVPGASHEYFECFESFFPAEGIEFIYYDQLGCGNSDNPNDTSLWNIERYVEEIEQIRVSLNLTHDNFFILGHSWGGVLALEYSLKYQANLKGIIISNMAPQSTDKKNHIISLLKSEMPTGKYDTLMNLESNFDFNNPEYRALLFGNLYTQHICRLPFPLWPEPLLRSVGNVNNAMASYIIGPSALKMGGKLKNWDRVNDLAKIEVPMLAIGAKYDTMDPELIESMAKQVVNGSYLYCSKGSHFSFYDDQQVYMNGVIQFIKEINKGNKKTAF